MVIQAKPMTVEEFEVFTELPDNADKLFEYIAGEAVEVPSNPYASNIASRINRRLGNFVEERDLGHITDGQGGYVVSGERYAPDVAFITKEKQPQLAQAGYNPNPPDLAVEVDFPSTYQSQKDLRVKIANYLAAGTMVWVVLPETKTVEIYVPGQPMKSATLDSVLDGDPVLPGFSLPVKEIFPD